MTIASTSFAPGKSIPQKYTCDGDDASPEMHWSNVPPGTNAFALIADDPDAPAGTWVHWVLYNIRSGIHELPEGLEKSESTAAGVQGINDFEKIGYGGPCPPQGTAHRYFFKLYALDRQVAAKPGASKKDIEAAIEGHILASAELMGSYQRKSR